MFAKLLGGALAAAVPLVVLAEEPATTATNRLAEVVVTGTRIPTGVERAPGSISVITRQEMEQAETRTVADVLRDQVDVNVASNGQPGGQTSVFLRGANANQTLVLIDGIRVNSAYNNAFDFANLPVDNIERIEILRGPQSTLYGSEALGGVINIVTKRGDGPPTGSVLAEGGSDDGLRTREAFSGRFGKLSLSGETSYFSTDNERINSDTSVWNGSGHASYQLLEHLSASLLGTYVQSKAGSPNDRFTNDPNDFLRNENYLIGLTLDAQPTEWWNPKLTLSHAQARAFFAEPVPNPPYLFGAFSEHTDTSRDQVDLQNIFTIGDQHKILIGGTYDNSHGSDTNDFSALSQTVEDEAVYGQYDFTPVERFTATAGGRVDHYSTFGTHGTYRFAGRYTTPGTETILRSSVGSGFRAPSMVQTFPPFGNPTLGPEESLGWDAGVEQPLAGNTLHVGATYFQNEFDHLIVSVPAPPPVYSTLVNTGRARTLGVETYATWTPVAALTLSGSYTWLAEAQDLSQGKPLIRRPTHSGSLSADYRFLKRFGVNVSTVLVGDRPDTNFSTFKSVDNAGYVKIDLALRCDVCKYFSVFGRVENLIDDRYEEVFGFPALGRTFWGGGTARF